MSLSRLRETPQWVRGSRSKCRSNPLRPRSLPLAIALKPPPVWTSSLAVRPGRNSGEGACHVPCPDCPPRQAAITKLEKEMKEAEEERLKERKVYEAPAPHEPRAPRAIRPL